MEELETYPNAVDFAWALFKERDYLLEASKTNKQALERICEHWNGIGGEIDPGLMARIAREALK